MRKYYIDNIRWTTIVLVVLYHVIYMFNSITNEGVIGPITSFHGQDAIQYLLYPWFMILLFIISGMCARFYLNGHSDKEFLKVRTRKLLVPSTIGLFVFQWIQGYFNMAISHAFTSFPDTMPKSALFFIMIFSGTGVLWTIQLMWIFSILLLLVRKIEKGRLVKIAENTNMAVLLLLGVFVWGSAQILNTPIIVVYRFGIYGFCFLLGYYVFAHESVIKQLEKFCIPLLVAAGVLGVTYTVLYYGENYAISPVVNSPLAIAYAWIACLAILGGAKHWWDKTNGFASFMTKKSFGLYVFHYLALSATAYGLVTYTSLPGIAIYGITGIASFVGGILIYEIISRIPAVRWCVLGIKKEKKNV
ncbi:acyltransferase family protein [Blautia sp. HCP3S3_G3]|uniref:acyltransferase family protein n=1 Tax=Blautia sp. HCP3S3_G3 TaxID=3438913 RepID=UPI003F89F3A5